MEEYSVCVCVCVHARVCFVRGSAQPVVPLNRHRAAVMGTGRQCLMPTEFNFSLCFLYLFSLQLNTQPFCCATDHLRGSHNAYLMPDLKRKIGSVTHGPF